MSKSKKKKSGNRAPLIDQVPLISLTDESGIETQYEYLDTIEYKEKNYCVLYPDVDSDAEDYIILEIVETDDPEYDDYRGVPDEKIMNTVFKIYCSRHQQPETK